MAPYGNRNSVGHGRPKKEIKWQQFEELCNMQCTVSEICSVLDLKDETLKKRAIEHYEITDFWEIYKKFSEGGKSSLRRMQFNLAKKNTAMAIWLGKIWLGQRDASIDAATQATHQLTQALIDAGISHKGTGQDTGQDRAPEQALPDHQ